VRWTEESKIAKNVLIRVASLALMTAAVGCGQQQADSPPQATSSPTSSIAQSSQPSIGVQFDPRWMGVVPDQPRGWDEQARTINAEFQQFDFRPVDETELPRGCNGCARWTAVLTAYAPGKFDAREARSGQPVKVNGDNDGYYRPADQTDDAMLTWQYAPDAWATVEGMTTMTAELDKMRELAAALRPDERAPIRLPLTLSKLPAGMPLAEVDLDDVGYGTRMKFSPCDPPDFGFGADSGCNTEADYLNVQIWTTDSYFGIIAEDRSVPVDIGGKDGLYDAPTNEAAAKVAPDMVVKFQLGKPGDVDPAADLKEILANVAWAPDPANEATWPTVSEWTK
jgi:hypothetical protein